MKWWMYLIVIGMLSGAVFATVRAVEHWWDDKKQEWVRQGWEGHVKFVQEQTAKAEQETKERQTELRNKSRKVKDEIQNEKTKYDDPIMPDIICNQLERMRDRRGVKSEQRCEDRRRVRAGTNNRQSN